MDALRAGLATVDELVQRAIDDMGCMEIGCHTKVAILTGRTVEEIARTAVYEDFWRTMAARMAGPPA